LSASQLHMSGFVTGITQHIPRVPQSVLTLSRQLDQCKSLPRGCALKFSRGPEAAPLDLLLNTGECAGFFNLDTFLTYTSQNVSGGGLHN